MGQHPDGVFELLECLSVFVTARLGGFGERFFRTLLAELRGGGGGAFEG